MYDKQIDKMKLLDTKPLMVVVWFNSTICRHLDKVTFAFVTKAKLGLEQVSCYGDIVVQLRLGRCTDNQRFLDMLKTSQFSDEPCKTNVCCGVISSLKSGIMRLALLWISFACHDVSQGFIVSSCSLHCVM
jgi:hypothetical protein